MPATHSAADEAARYKLEAEQSHFIIATAWRMHRQYAAAADTEARLGLMLGPLEQQGFRVLSDRLWPRSNRANVDFVLVGPTGVIIVDAKSWVDVSIVDDRVFQCNDDVTDRFANLGSLAEVAQKQLAEIGMAPGEVRVVAVFMGERNLRGRVSGVDLISEDGALDYLLNRGARLRPAQVDAAVAATEELFPRYEFRERAIELASPGELIITVDEIEQALETSVLAAPIDDWMAFLHPDQARLVRRSFNGPSRIRGAAGTGKTIVGLHRAAHLARSQPGKVLVTTLMRTLPVVLSSKLERMAPDVVDRVEFAGIYAFAEQLLTERGLRVNVDTSQADTAFDRAWERVGAGGILDRIDPLRDYWKDEIRSVIKGRGLMHYAEYARLVRVGRRRGLSAKARRAVWALRGEYDLELRERGLHDSADLILMAETSLRAEPLTGYSSVIADEAQDFTLAMIRMLHALVGDAPDGLNLIDDGQQNIYPGGYTLGEANVSIAGRGVIMTRNFRNTIEISDFASSLVIGDHFEDIEGADWVPDETLEPTRHGARPRVSRFTSRSGHERSIVAHLHSLLAAGISGGDIAVLTQTSVAAIEVMLALSNADIPAMDLRNHDGRASDTVKVGTIKRAKGLEFKQVLVVRAPARLLESASPDADANTAERRELERRELYVAMTRARDGLWVGVG
jgi:UvrD-like helicase C-terminal domain/AAA domain/Nuclease-related domain